MSFSSIFILQKPAHKCLKKSEMSDYEFLKTRQWSSLYVKRSVRSSTITSGALVETSFRKASPSSLSPAMQP